MSAGTVNASDLSCFYHFIYDAHKYDCESNPETVHGIVHAYGEYAYGSLSESNDCVTYTEIGDVLRSKTNPKYYCRRTPPGQQEFAYRFLEYNPHNHQRTYPFLTNRTITTSAGSCYTYSVSHVDTGTVEGGKWSNYTYANKTFQGSILLPVEVDTFDGTVYIYNDLEIPQNAASSKCGPRCMWMWAHKTVNPKTPSTFYQCPIKVNEVQNTWLDQHRVSPEMALLAASAIGLQGGKSDSVNGWRQFQFYPISYVIRLFTLLV